MHIGCGLDMRVLCMLLQQLLLFINVVEFHINDVHHLQFLPCIKTAFKHFPICNRIHGNAQRSCDQWRKCGRIKRGCRNLVRWIERGIKWQLEFSQANHGRIASIKGNMSLAINMPAWSEIWSP